MTAVGGVLCIALPVASEVAETAKLPLAGAPLTAALASGAAGAGVT